MNTENPRDDDLSTVLDEYRVYPASDAFYKRVQSSVTQSPQVANKATTGTVASALQELLAAIGGWSVTGPTLAFSFALGLVLNPWPESPRVSPSLSFDNSTIWELALLANSDNEDESP